MPLTKETVIDKNLWEATLFPMWGKKKKNHNTHKRRKTGTSDTTSLLKMVVQNAKKITNPKMAQINYFKSNISES